MQDATIGNSPTKFFWNFSKLTLVVSVLWGTYVSSCRANPDDNSLEYFLSHAHALVRDVRKDVLEPQYSNSYKEHNQALLKGYEQELKMKLEMFRSWKGDTREPPKDSERFGGPSLVIENVWLRPVTYVERHRVVPVGLFDFKRVDCSVHRFWGIEAFLIDQGISIKRHFNFNDFPLPGVDIDKAYFIQNVMRAHCNGFTENSVKRYFPKGTPFDSSISESISEFLGQVRELKPFWQKNPGTDHPYVQFFDMVLPFVVPHYNPREDSAHNFMDTLKSGKGVGESKTASEEGIQRDLWNEFFEWVQKRLDRIPTAQSNDDVEAKPNLHARFGERLKRLLKIHPIKDGFTLNSPPRFDDFYDSAEE